MARSRQAGMRFILVTLFLDVLGLGIVIPVLPELVVDFLHGDASEAARWYGLLASSYAVMQLLFAPVLGALSDRYGRRPVLLASLAGFGLNYVLLALAPSLTWLFVARILSGITGASFTTANAYVADVSTPADRARNFGLMGAMFGLGFVFGPAIGGLLGTLGPRVPFWVAAGVVALNWAYGLLVLPESLPPDQRRAVSLREANPLGGLVILSRYPLVAGLAATFFFSHLAHRAMETVWVLYTHYRFGWEALENGLTLALVGVMSAIVQGGLVKRIVGRLGEGRSIMVGLGVGAFSFLLYGLAFQGWMMLPIIVLAAFGAIAGPAVQSLVAGEVPSSEQGAVQGALTSLVSLTAVLSPLVASQAFASFTGEEVIAELPGVPFFLGTLAYLVALGVGAWVLRERLSLPARAGEATPPPPPDPA